MDDKQKEIEELKRQRDEFRIELITRAGELQCMVEEKDELVRERDALVAYSKRLEEAFAPFMSKKQIAVDGFVMVPQYTYNVWILALNEVPEQSLNHIKAQVEEETIERCVALIQDDPNTYRDGSDIALENMPRKYAKQAGPTVEEGE